ncbi:MAG: DUF1330 domain-containing protein [Gaiellaceae bacterium]
MAFYVIVSRAELKDEELLRRYVAEVSATVERYGGSYDVVTASPETLEGEWRPKSLVVFHFPTREQALAWWESDEYAPLKALRRQAVVDDIVLVEGL